MFNIVFKRGILVHSLIVISLSVILITSFLLEGEYLATAVLNNNIDRARVDMDLEVQKCCWLGYENLSRNLLSNTFLSNLQLIQFKSTREIIIRTPDTYFYPTENSTGQISVFGYDKLHVWFGNISIIEGRLPKAPDEVAIDLSLKNILNLSVGVNVNISNPSSSLTKVFRVVGVFKASGSLWNYIYSKPMIDSPIPFRIQNATIGALLFNISSLISWDYMGVITPTTTHYLIKIKKSYYVNPWDTKLMLSRVKNVENIVLDIAKEISGTNQVYIKNYLEEIINDYSRWPTIFRYQLLYMILPGLLASSLAAIVVGWIYIYKRKKEIAILKARGYSNGKLLKLTVFEFALVAFLSTIISIVSSVLLAYLVAIYGFPQYSSRYDPWSIIVNSLQNYVLANLFLAFFISFLEVFPPTLKALKINILEGISPHSHVIETEKPSQNSYIFFAIGVLSWIEILSNLSIYKFINSNLLSSQSVLIQVTGIVFLIFDVIIITAGPFSFVYGLAGLIGLNIRRFEVIFKKLAGIFVGDKVDLSISHFRTKPARFIRMLFILMILSGFIVEAELNASSLDHSMASDLRLILGADYNVKITGFVSRTPLTLSTVDKLNGMVQQIKSSIPNSTVASIYIEWTNPTLGIGKRLPYIVLVGVDEDYFKVTSFKEDYLEGTSLNKAKSLIFDIGDGGLISISAKDYGVNIGDNITLGSTRLFSAPKLNFKICGYIKALPGLINRVDALYQGDYLYLLVNKAKFWELLKIPSVILINAKTTDQDLVLERLSKIIANAGLYADVYVYSNVYRQLKERSLIGIIISLYHAESLIFLLLALFITFMINEIETNERRKEYAFLIARGYDKKTLIRMYATEFLFIILIAILFGLLAAVNFTLSLVAYSQFLGETQQLYVVTERLYFNLYVWGITVFFFAIGILIAIYTVRKSLRIKITKELRTPL